MWWFVGLNIYSSNFIIFFLLVLKYLQADRAEQVHTSHPEITKESAILILQNRAEQMASKATLEILTQKKLTNVRQRRNPKSIVNPLAKKQQIQASVSLLADSSKVGFGSKLCLYCLIWHSTLNWNRFPKEIKVLLWGYDRQNKLLERKRCIYFIFITERGGEVDQFAISDVVIEMPIENFHQIHVNGTKFGKTKS